MGAVADTARAAPARPAALLDALALMQQQLEGARARFEDLKMLYVKAVNAKYRYRTEVYALRRENEGLAQRLDEMERFYTARCRLLRTRCRRRGPAGPAAGAPGGPGGAREEATG
jgi:hypothetical protein